MILESKSFTKEVFFKDLSLMLILFYFLTFNILIIFCLLFSFCNPLFFLKSFIKGKLSIIIIQVFLAIKTKYKTQEAICRICGQQWQYCSKKGGKKFYNFFLFLLHNTHIDKKRKDFFFFFLIAHIHTILCLLILYLICSIDTKIHLPFQQSLFTI